MGRMSVNPSAMAEIDKRGRQLLDDMAQQVVSRAKTTAPVLTGEYRDGIEAETTGDPDMINVGSTSGHAIYVEARTGNVVKALAAAHE